MASLEIVIGLILIILFYSLLATILMELFSSFLALRGKHLLRVLRSILAGSDRKEEIFEDFTDNAIFRQLAGKNLGKTSPPSYLGAGDFRSILLKVISNRQKGQPLSQQIAELPDEGLKDTLEQFLEETGNRFDLFQEKIEEWYDSIMDRANGWYKRNIQIWLLALGFVIAVLFNVDTIDIYSNLSSASQADLEQLTALSQSISEQNEAYSNEAMVSLLEENLENLKAPLGIGWDQVPATNDLFFWLLKIFGWLITAVCISKGAPFWFDLLKRAIQFRNSGNLPPKALGNRGDAAPLVHRPSAGADTTPYSSLQEHTTIEGQSFEAPVG